MITFQTWFGRAFVRSQQSCSSLTRTVTCSRHPLRSTGANIRRTRRLSRALGQRGRQKYNCAGSESDVRTPKREWIWWKWM